MSENNYIDINVYNSLEQRVSAVETQASGLESAFAKIQQYVTIHEEDRRQNREQHDNMSDKFSDFSTRLALTEDRYAAILDTLKDMKRQITTLTEKPAKRWDSAVMAAVTGIVGAFIGWWIR